jgi:hypothetical protein
MPPAGPQAAGKATAQGALLRPAAADGRPDKAARGFDALLEATSLRAQRDSADAARPTPAVEEAATAPRALADRLGDRLAPAAAATEKAEKPAGARRETRPALPTPRPAPDLSPAAAEGVGDAAPLLALQPLAPPLPAPDDAPPADRDLAVQRFAALVGATPEAAEPLRDAAGERPFAPYLPAARDVASREAPPPLAAPVDGGEPMPLEVRLTRLSATVARLETHLPPVQPPALAPIERKGDLGRVDTVGLFDQIRSALDGGGGERTGAETRSAPVPAASPTPASPIRILEIALQPAALGSLTVTFRLTSTGTLKVAVTATERETAIALEEDTDALAAVVAAAGYTVEEITVRHAARG